MRIHFRFVCAVLLLAMSTPLHSADPVWIQITSRNFKLFTDTTEVKGRRLLEDLEGRLVALSSALGEIPQRQFPIEVLLFSKKEDFLEAAPRPAGPDAPAEFPKSAYLWRGPDRIFIGARDKTPGEISEDVGHALGHVFFERSTIWRPFWLAEGAAEYFRKVGRNPDNKKVSDKDGYPVEDLLEIIPTKQYDDDAPPTAFRLQSHRLLRLVLSRHGSGFRALLKELRTLDGQSAKLDIDKKIIQSDFDSFSETLIPPGTGSFDIKVAPLTPGAMSIHRGDLLLAAKKTSEAASWYQGDNGEARAARAILARFSRSGGEPIRLLSSVASSSPESGLVLFHLGSIETKVPEDLQQQVQALNKATVLMPRLGRAHGQLARVDTLIGKGNEALVEVDRALELEPEFADQFYLTRAEALLALGRFGDANAAASLAAALPHLDKSIDYDLKTSELTRRVDEARQELDAKQLQKIREEVTAIVAEREPPPPPPPPRPPERFGAIEYSVQSNRPIRIANAPLPVYSNALIQSGKAGNITVRVTIGSDGKVTQASVIDSQLQEMNAATLDAAKKWIFTPGTPPATLEARIVFRFSVQ